VPTGEPDNTERVPSGSVGGWGKRSVSYLARSLPNLCSRFRQRLMPGVGPTAWPAQQELTEGICKGVFQLSTL
jgi:hypothetical protein